jgi:hypothetical protein
LTSQPTRKSSRSLSAYRGANPTGPHPPDWPPAWDKSLGRRGSGRAQIAPILFPAPIYIAPTVAKFTDTAKDKDINTDTDTDTDADTDMDIDKDIDTKMDNDMDMDTDMCHVFIDTRKTLIFSAMLGG